MVFGIAGCLLASACSTGDWCLPTDKNLLRGPRGLVKGIRWGFHFTPNSPGEDAESLGEYGLIARSFPSVEKATIETEHRNDVM